jgi:hypothetical protein
MKKTILPVLILILTAEIARADFTFGEPTLFDEPVNSSGVEYFNCISADGLEIYIEKPVGGGVTASNWDLYVSTRETTIDPWSVPVRLGNMVNKSDSWESHACISEDGLELYFASNRSDGYGGADIWVTKRDHKGADWGAAANLGPMINTSVRDSLPWITPDGLELYFSSERPGGYGGNDIWAATRASTNDEWVEPINLGPVVNSTAGEFHPCLAPGGLVLFFSDFDNTNYGFQPGGYGLSDMYMTRRKSTTDAWEPPVNLGPDMNTNAWDSKPRVSPDGSVLYFTSSRPESRVMTEKSDIWQVPIIPIIDFNGDGIVDSADICTIVDYWGEKYSLCDIGPTPLGDGIVDVLDLIVLSEHLFEEVSDPTLVAHWALDETEGDIAYDSVSVCDGILNGNPVWQPDGGIVGGALQFDGTDDHVATDPVLSPADPEISSGFSVVAWVMGGVPGQAVLSQADGSNWLCLDSIEGCLMTELKGSGRSSGGPLLSETNVTDGTWHRIALVWDGSYRHLYVDGAEVAKDAAPLSELEGTSGGLYLGAGSTLATGTFFSGLIDDIRMYNRAVHP